MRFLGVVSLCVFALTANAEARTASISKPINLKVRFTGTRLPEGWRIESGNWQPEKSRGLFCNSEEAVVAALLREDMLRVKNASVRIELWVNFDYKKSAGAVEICWGPLVAGLDNDGKVSLVVRSESNNGNENKNTERVVAIRAKKIHGRARITLDYKPGLVTLALDGKHAITLHDCSKTIEAHAPQHLYINARHGTHLIALVLEAEAVALQKNKTEEKSPAEFAMEQGLKLVAENKTALAIDKFDVARRLLPNTELAERARLEMGFVALRLNQPELAMRYAKEAAVEATDGVKNAAQLATLTKGATEALLKIGMGARSTPILEAIMYLARWRGNSVLAYEMELQLKSAYVARKEAANALLEKLSPLQ